MFIDLNQFICHFYEKIDTNNLIRQLDELYTKREKLRKNQEVVKLMNYVADHLFTIHIKVNVPRNWKKTINLNPSS